MILKIYIKNLNFYDYPVMNLSKLFIIKPSKFLLIEFFGKTLENSKFRLAFIEKSSVKLPLIFTGTNSFIKILEFIKNCFISYFIFVLVNLKSL